MQIVRESLGQFKAIGRVIGQTLERHQDKERGHWAKLISIQLGGTSQANPSHKLTESALLVLLNTVSSTLKSLALTLHTLRYINTAAYEQPSAIWG